ncbi:type II secretion system protein [Sulfurovum sp.]|uniref:type II secretion system protein n=1 Tax=Sulfurovum sp. TaxID=1969726 RepID=UPI002867B6C8|nr:type II secretion system protein [Sulfurovum sp.]
MDTTHKRAFTMIELVFVIVVIGILSAVAIPKFAVTRDDAIIAKEKATISAVRSALATERQKRILRGDFEPITSMSNGGTGSITKFSNDANGLARDVLEYPVPACTTGQKGCWSVSGTTYTFMMPISGSVDFNITNNRFDCKVPADSNCKLLTQ